MCVVACHAIFGNEEKSLNTQNREGIDLVGFSGNWDAIRELHCICFIVFGIMPDSWIWPDWKKGGKVK